MRVLIVGMGSIAKKHILALRSILTNVSIYALRSSLKSLGEPGVIDLYDISELHTIKFDFVIISNPTHLHKETVQALIQYNIPLFIEKPVFDNLHVDKLLEEIEQKGITTYVACNLRFLDCIGFVKEFINGRRINEVNSYCGSYLPDWRPGKDFREVYSANKEMGGGVHIDLIHEMDYVYWLFGPPDSILSTKRSNSSLEIPAIDYANYLLQYPLFCVNIVLNYYRRDSKRNLEVLFEDGTLIVDLLTNKVCFNNEVIFESDKKIADTYKDQMKFFINNVLGNKIKLNSVKEAVEVLKLCITND